MRRFIRGTKWGLWSGTALLAVGAALLIWCGWAWHQASVAQSQARKDLARRPTVQTPAASGAKMKILHRGDVVGELAIPRLHLSVMVLEGDDDGILKLAAGHISGTALAPGSGNIGIAAHRDTFFRPLRAIRRSDLVTLKTPAGVARFSVTGTEIVRPSEIEVLAAAPGRDLTLVTCYPFHYIGSAPERFIVHARLTKNWNYRPRGMNQSSRIEGCPTRVAARVTVRTRPASSCLRLRSSF